MLKLMLLLLGLAVCTAQAADINVTHSQDTADRPNVLFVLGDDFSYGQLSYYGNPVLKTPNFDKLAKEGVRFENFYVSSVCSPTRAQLYTGYHEFKVGVTNTAKDGQHRVKPGETFVSELFKQGGYATGLFGKWHLAPGAQSKGFDHIAPTGYNKHWDPTINGKKYKGYRTDVIFGLAMEWMDQQLGRRTPFFCHISTNNAHNSPDPNGPGNIFVAPKEFTDPMKGKVKSPDLLEKYGMVANFDMNFGRILKYLDERGIADNTILIFMTDNGMTSRLGPEGYNAGMRGTKDSEYRGGSRVPFLFRYPAEIQGDRTVDELTGGMDFLPTMVDLCGLPKKEGIDGISLAPLLRGEVQSLPDRFLPHHHRLAYGKVLESKYINYAVQSKHFRLVNNKELYDHRTDPGEQNNVIEQHPELVAKIREFYEAWWNECLSHMINEKRYPFSAEIR